VSRPLAVVSAFDPLLGPAPPERRIDAGAERRWSIPILSCMRVLRS